MSHYKSNLRDLEFNLFEFLGRGEILGHGPYSEVDEQTARDILAEVERLATHELAASLVDSDRNPPTFDPATSSVTMPESFRRSYQAYMDSEWWRMDLPPELGGTVVPPSVRWAAQEMVLGANPAVHMFAIGPAFAHLLWRNGTAAQKRLAQLMVDKRWGATMMLTEPDAGSDVGAGRTKAIRQPDGTWHIEGVKRFITSGESDLADNIVHFVLARPEGHGPGTKGLSLFVVPKFLVDLETGELKDRNGVYAANLEHKMGLKASTTCEMRFGERHPAIGTLLGDRHDGIAQMFQIIENARMMVGTKAIATLSTGYRHAVEFARTRVQGPDLTQAADKSAPKVTIIHHPDVRRLLMLQKSYAEGMRALGLYAASIQDGIYAARLLGLPPDDGAVRLNGLLLPIVKGVGSERSYALLADALQVLGGSGFLQDYPLEQYLRDSKIDTLYEGTTAIQAMDLFFRKIVRDNGQAFAALGEQIHRFAKGDAGNGSLAAERDRLGTAFDDVRGILATMAGAVADSAADPTSIYKVGQNTTRLLLAAGDLIIGWLLLRQAEVALAALAARPRTDQDLAFYEGKVAAARFFAHQVLPQLSAQRVSAEAVDNSLMAVPEAAF